MTIPLIPKKKGVPVNLRLMGERNIPAEETKFSLQGENVVDEVVYMTSGSGTGIRTPVDSTRNCRPTTRRSPIA
jgi:hypothetical protein